MKNCLIDTSLIDEITLKAASSPRKRMNHNFHETLDAKAQRLINVLLPGTQLPVHRHTETAETYILISGNMKVLFYNDQGAVIETFHLDPLTGHHGVHIPVGQWHGIEVIEPSAIFEVKDGPYRPLTPDDILATD